MFSKMKKNLSVLFFLIAIFSFSQEVSFDYLIEKISGSKEKYTSFKFFNSKTKQFLSVNKHNQKFIGSLYDGEKKMLHYFHIYEKDGKYNAVYSDSYIYNSLPNVNSEDDSGTFIEMNKIDELRYAAHIFDKNRSRKSSIITEITLEKSAFNFFEISIDSPGRFSLSKSLEKEVSRNECCYRIAQYEVAYSKNNKYSIINIFNKVDLKLVLPVKLKIKRM